MSEKITQYEKLRNHISSRALTLKILLVTCGFTVLICYFSSQILYETIEKSSYDKEIQEMNYSSSTIAYIIESTINQAKTDVTLLAHSSELKTLIQSNNQEAKDLLSKKFIQLLQQRQHYFQIRYISTENEGQEIVRTERDGNGTPINQQKLQKKGEEHYYKQALLNADVDVYTSRLDYNREMGKLEQPKRPVIRLIKIIKDANNTPLGMIVINADYSQILGSLNQITSRVQNLRILNEEGDYITYNKNEQRFIFKLNEYDEKPDQFMLLIQNKIKETDSKEIVGTLELENNLVHYKKIAQKPNSDVYSLIIILSKNINEIKAYAIRSKQYIYLLGATLLVFGWMLTLTLTNSIRTALQNIGQQILNYAHNNARPNLPVKRLDEVGELAKAIDEVIIRLENSKEQEKQTREYLQATIDTALDAIITIDDLGIIQTFNPSAEKIFGYTKDEVIGKNVKVLMPEPYRGEHDQYIHNYKNTGHAKIIGIGRDVTGLRKNGETFPMELGVNRMTKSGQFVFVGTIRDITERKQAEEEMIRSNEELERFAYVASHDLREPLRIISSFTELLEDQYKNSLDEKGTQCMDFILEATNRMQDMINDLLDYSRAGTNDIEFEDVDCNKTLEIVESNLTEMIEQSNAQILYKKLPTINARPIRMVRLFQNLIGNAIKYRSKDRDPEIVIKVAENEDEWQFSVKDNGIGMKQEHLQKIFIIFQRLHRRDEYSGTGIGLAISKRIVESFGGTIWVESEEGKGSTFFFTIPKRDTQNDNIKNLNYA